MSVAPPKIFIHDLHQELDLWLDEIDFIKTELKMLENKMSYLALTNVNNNERMAMLEQLQNQMIRQKEVTDEIRHKVQTAAQQLAEKARKMNPAEIQHKNVSYHNELKEDVERYKELYKQFKKNLTDFILHWE